MKAFVRGAVLLGAYAVSISAAQAGEIVMTKKPATRSVYMGIIMGYAQTTWSNIVGKDQFTLNATPESAKEGGADWGAQLGFEVNRGFALETAYYHFSDAVLGFQAGSEPAIEAGSTSVTSRTQAVVFDSKIYTPLSQDGRWRLYGKIGMEATNRRDVLAHYKWRIGAIFGMGFSYDWGQHLMYQAGFDYLTGYGESEYLPLAHYTPFVYAANTSISYKIAI